MVLSRTVLVTGGNRGIGLATAQAFVAAGHRVAVTHHHHEPPPDLFAVECDVRDPVATDRAFTAVEDTHGPVEVLVCCAGITQDNLLVRMSHAQFTAVLDTNLTGVFNAVQRASMRMVRGRWGRMVFISSVGALWGEVGQANYSAAKAGLIGLARSTARELGPKGVTANVVAPGLTDTDMVAQLSPERIDAVVRQIPVGRLGRPADVAAAVMFFASEEASYITGTFLAVDGGAAPGH